MALIWERLAEKSRTYAVEDYERAAYRLVTQQVLSAGDAATRKDYHLVAENMREYVQALEPLGIILRHNPQFRYVVAQPRHVIHQNKASKATTLLILVLADIYHHVRFNGQEGDMGEAYVELPDLQETYQGLTGYDFPRIGELREQMAEVERWGIAAQHEVESGDTQPFRVVIHPAISEIVTKEWLGLLDGLRKVNDEQDKEESRDVSA